MRTSRFQVRSYTLYTWRTLDQVVSARKQVRRHAHSANCTDNGCPGKVLASQTTVTLNCPDIKYFGHI